MLVSDVLIVLALGWMFALVTSCGPVRRVAGDVVDCTRGETKTLIDQFGPVVDTVLVNATAGDGHVDVAQLKAAAKNFGKEIGGCVLASSVQRALSRSTGNTGGPQVSPVQAEPAALRAAFDAVRLELGGGTYRTTAGDL